MHSDKVAKLLEHSTVEIREVKIMSGHGELPSNCITCNGPLDFTRISTQTVLKCRNCGNIIQLED